MITLQQERTSISMRLYQQPQAPLDKVPLELARRYESEAGRFWELFYRRNSDRFFRDRHYFDKEFPQLLSGPLVVLEVGCGVGNSVFPLLELNPQLRVFACDFSPTAVQLVQAHPQFAASGRVSAFVADITAGDLPAHLPPGAAVDYCSMVFVLSAVAPEKMPQAVRNVASVLKRGSGRVLFRDYAAGDLAQLRLEDASGAKLITDSFYVRGDGTCCYYYSQACLSELFAAEGFVTESLLVHERLVENRKSGVKMDRRWIQGVFRYDPDAAAGQTQQQQQRQRDQQQSEQLVPAAALQPQQQLDVLVQQLAAGSCEERQVAGGSWLLPCSLSAAACERGLLLAKLLQEQRLQLLGAQLLIAPPWLQLQCAGQLAPAPAPPAIVCLTGVQRQCSSSSRTDVASCDTAAAQQGQQAWQQQLALEQGAAAGLVALVAVWQGARRVYACLPSGAGAFAAGFRAVLQLNEARVVCERVRQRVWQQGEARQLQMLQQEVLQQPGGVSPAGCSLEQQQRLGPGELQDMCQAFLERVASSGRAVCCVLLA